MEQSPSWEADQFSQLTKKFPAFYGTQSFFTVLTSARHLSLSWANSNQSQRLPPTSTSILILSSHLRLGLPNGLFPSGFPTNTLNMGNRSSDTDRENRGKSQQVKHSRYRPAQAQRVDTCIALSFSDHGARRGWVFSTAPRPLYPRERPGTHYTGGWVGSRTGLKVCEKSRPHRDSIPGPSSP
jgi:hypothetical protein